LYEENSCSVPSSHRIARFDPAESKADIGIYVEPGYYENGYYPGYPGYYRRYNYYERNYYGDHYRWHQWHRWHRHHHHDDAED
jgi:hypothetical protein